MTERMSDGGETELETALRWLDQAGGGDSAPFMPPDWHQHIADLITRLAAAERAAREELRTEKTLREAADWALKNTDATKRAEAAERDLAAMRERAEKAERERRDVERCLNPLDAVVHHLGIEDSFTDPVDAIKAIERQRDEALAALEKARADALEEAKSACLDLTGSDATPTLRPGARMCVRRIDHLKDQTP